MDAPLTAAPAAIALSVVVPALNEGQRIANCLQPLQAMRVRGTEVIVVDGGSGDDTRAVSRPLSDRVIDSPAGRARQMNRGRLANARRP